MPLPRTSLVVSICLALAEPLAAQCLINASAGSPQPELTGYAHCSTLWDPDGAGPLSQRLVVGGHYFLAGAHLQSTQLPSAQRVMTWDGSTWEPLDSGPGTGHLSSVQALISWDGELVAGGTFTGGPSYIARWDGTSWQALGGGFSTDVDALANWNGYLVAAGHVGSLSAPVPVLKLWDGATWTALPAPPLLGAPTAMVEFEGELIVAGSVSGSSPAQGVLERWNGTSWATSIVANSTIAALAVRRTLAVGGSDTLLVGGGFTSIGSTAVSHIARTSGAPAFAWSSVGGGLPSGCSHLHVHNSGLSDYVVVARTANTTTPVLRYTTATGTWSALGNWTPLAITSFAGSYHGVTISTTDTACRRWDGTQWVPVRGPGIVGEVHAMTRSGNDMVIGGNFATVSGIAMNCIARWDGSTFTPLGSGMTGSSVDALLTLDNGDIVAGGSFTSAGGTAANHVARWNGTSWAAMGSGMDQRVYALAKMPNGDVVAGGAFTNAGGAWCSRIARWNGTAWSPMHTGMNDDVLALVVRDDGTLFAGGKFTIASTFSRYRVAQWTGSVWGQVGAAMNDAVHGLAARPNGDVIAVGAFTQASLLPVDRIARWNGSSWVTMGASSSDPDPVRAVWTLPNGDIVAGRDFGQPTGWDFGLSRWNGSTWNGIGQLTGWTTNAAVHVRALAQRADGDLVVGGDFNLAGYTMASSLVALASDCMPTSVGYGTGCSSPAGPLALTADTLPFLGAPFRTTTTGVAAGSLCLSVIGLTQLAIPLDALLAEGQPGCTLLSSLDILMLALPDGSGVARSSFALNDDPSLIGVPFFQQTIPLEFDGSGAMVAVRGSNALSLLIGTL